MEYQITLRTALKIVFPRPGTAIYTCRQQFPSKQDHTKQLIILHLASPMNDVLVYIGLTIYIQTKDQMTFQHSNVSFCTPSSVNSMKAKKRVQLHPTVSVQEFNVEPLTREEKAELYYSQHDIDNFMLENREIAFSHEFTQKMCKTGCTDEQDNNRSHVAAEEDGFLRGIEMLIYPQRSQNKLIARRALIKYQTYLQTQRTDITAEQKASAMRTASEKLSKWSHLVAQETARLDSLRAYDAEYLIPLDDQRVEFSTSPEHMFKKTRPFKKARTAM